jgi:hypothetical protein
MDVPPPPQGGSIPADAQFTLYRRDRELAFDAERTFWGSNPVGAGFSFVETYRPDDPAVLVPLRRLAGPHLSAAFIGAATAPYTGARRLFAAFGDVAAYPRAWNSAGFGFVDARGQLSAVVPLPLYRRHTLALGVRARELVGLPEGERVLLVGGYLVAPLWRRAESPETLLIDYPGLPPGARFVEPLRGFEDHAFATDRIAIAQATYRLPFIIDYGWASTLGLLPSLFVRQIDLDLFGVAATEGRNGARHTAAGGALTLRAAMWVVPISLQYQLARRFTDDQALVHLVVLGI